MPVSYYLYAFPPCNVLGRDTYAYMSVSVQKITHVTAPILSSRLGWYEPYQTIITVPLLISTEIWSPDASTYKTFGEQ